MKKLFFIAAIAGVALASCTKNEVVETTPDQLITFSTPVVGNLTKVVAGEVGVNYDKNEKFNVYGWYCEADNFTPSEAVLYMDGVTVQHTPDINVDADAGTAGAWAPVTAYYWPKNGKLTFSAFSPADATVDATSVTCDVTNGLTISSFTVKEDPAEQYDLLYSDRAYNKTSSLGETNDVYDGVDLQFRHALSSIHVKVKTDMSYPEGTITINKIELQNVYNTADFKESLVNGTETESNSTAKWVGHYNSNAVVLGKTDQEAVYDAAKYGTTAILIPQVFDHAKDGITTLYIEYTIKNADNTSIKQRASFKLNEYTGEIDGTDVGLISQWVKGYRYTYNITIGLAQIYFAPTVENWKDIDITFPQI